MGTRASRRGLWATGLSLALAGLAGCQTWTWDSGMTLPSGRYLQHQPQYIPPSPPFPLSNELAAQERAAAAASPAAAAGAPAPETVPPPPVPVPAAPGLGGPAPAGPAGAPVVPGPVQ